MKLSLERKIALGFGTALFVLLLVTIAAWWNVVRFQNTQNWVEHTREVLGRLDQVLRDMLGMQASARGYVLSGSDDVLAPFNGNSAHLDNSLRELRQLTADNPRQLARLERLLPLAENASAIMRGRIEARRTRGLDAAMEQSAYPDGQRAVDEFSRIVREMVKAERELLDDRLRHTKAVARLTVFSILAASAMATGFVAIAVRRVQRDLARRREAEFALQESFVQVEDLYNNAPCGYHSLDHAGTFITINDTALRWLGYTRDEMVGRMNFADILSPGSALLFRERFPSFQRAGRAENVEYEWRRRDGATLPVLLNATAVYDPAGRYVSSRATVFDITVRKRLQAERDRFFTLARDLLCIAGFDGYFKRVNPAWEEALGFSAEELLGRPFIEFVHEDDRERTLAESVRLAAGQDSPDFENRFRCKDGSYRWLRWSSRSVPAENTIYASARDITDRKEADERIQWLNADLEVRALQLESANRELESFSYSVSHDLRAPLRHIDGFASLLTKRAADALDAEGRRYVATISKAAKQMGTLIDDLLAFSRIGRVPLRLEPVNHDQLVADVIADGRYESAAPALAWEIGPLPRVRADAAMLRQVWANLIENAVKYSAKAAAPRITIGGTENVAAGEAVFFVRDNGVGFDMAYADKLFGVFQRLHAPADFEGTGIGLANVRRIVSRHGGRTWAEGRVDEGAVFYFSLPLPPPSSGSAS